MNETGIVRRIDDLGRVVIPKELRKILDVRSCDAVEFFVGKGGELILRKYQDK